MEETEINFPIRLNRFLALRGIATRRVADELIESGLVLIDGRVAKIGAKLENQTQQVTIHSDAKKNQETFVYFAYYKPRGIITHSPQGKERSIVETSGVKGIFPVGRLDKDSEGLIILTNDGRVTERLLHPRFAHEKEYVVTVRETLIPELKKKLETGVEEGGERLKAKQVTLLDKHTATLTLTEGKKHEIRRMLGVCRYTVTSLKRVRIMGVYLGALRPGEKRALTSTAKEKFLANLGL